MVNKTQQGGKRAGEARDAVLTRAFGVGAMDCRPPCGCGGGACLHPGLTSRMLSLAPTSVVAASVVGLSLLAPAVQAQVSTLVSNLGQADGAQRGGFSEILPSRSRPATTPGAIACAASQ